MKDILSPLSKLIVSLNFSVFVGFSFSICASLIIPYITDERLNLAPWLWMVTCCNVIAAFVWPRFDGVLRMWSYIPLVVSSTMLISFIIDFTLDYLIPKFPPILGWYVLPSLFLDPYIYEFSNKKIADTRNRILFHIIFHLISIIGSFYYLKRKNIVFSCTHKRKIYEKILPV